MGGASTLDEIFAHCHNFNKFSIQIMTTNDLIESEIELIRILPETNKSPGRISISFTRGENDRWELTLYDVKYFHLNQMNLQNIVESIEIISHQDIDKINKIASKKIQYLLRGGIDSDYPLNEVVSNLIIDIKNGKLSLIEIKPIYGCYALALAKEINLNKLSI